MTHRNYWLGHTVSTTQSSTIDHAYYQCDKGNETNSSKSQGVPAKEHRWAVNTTKRGRVKVNIYLCNQEWETLRCKQLSNPTKWVKDDSDSTLRHVASIYCETKIANSSEAIDLLSLLCQCVLHLQVY